MWTILSWKIFSGWHPAVYFVKQWLRPYIFNAYSFIQINSPLPLHIYSHKVNNVCKNWHSIIMKRWSCPQHYSKYLAGISVEMEYFIQICWYTTPFLLIYTQHQVSNTHCNIFTTLFTCWNVWGLVDTHTWFQIFLFKNFWNTKHSTFLSNSKGGEREYLNFLSLKIYWFGQSTFVWNKILEFRYFIS